MSVLALIVAVFAAVVPGVDAALADWSPVLTAPGGSGTGTNNGIMRQLLADPRRGGFWACGQFSGLLSVPAQGIAHVSQDGSVVTPLAGPGPAGALSGVACTAVALDPLDPDSLYVGLRPTSTWAYCGLPSNLANQVMLCKWSFSGQNWTMIARAAASQLAVIRAISPSAGTVFFGGDWNVGCVGPTGFNYIASFHLCKVVGNTVMPVLRRSGVRGASGIIRAIVPMGSTAPAWLAARGADPASANYICGVVDGLVIMANDAGNSTFVTEVQVSFNDTQPIQALDGGCWTAKMISTGAPGSSALLVGGAFRTFSAGATRVSAPKLAIFDGTTARAVAPTLPTDSTAAIAADLDTTSGLVYASFDSHALNSVVYGYILRANLMTGIVSTLPTSSGLPGVQLAPGSPPAPAPCAAVRDYLGSVASPTDGCRPHTILALPNGRIAVGGAFERVNRNTVVNGFAFWANEAWQPFGIAGAGANDLVYAVAQLGPGRSSPLVLGGTFSFVGNVSARLAAVVQPADGAAPGFVLPLSPALTTPAASVNYNAVVRAVLPVTDPIPGFYITEFFSGPGNNIAFCTVPSSGASSASCSPLIDNSTAVNGIRATPIPPAGIALAQLSGDIFVGGNMADCGGGPSIACRWQPSTRRFFTLGVSGSAVSTLAADEARATLWIGGAVQSQGSASPSYSSIVGWRNGSFVVLPSSPGATGTTGLNAPVYTIAVLGDVMYVGGEFTGTADLSMALSRVAGYSFANQTFFPLMYPGATGRNVNGVDNVVAASAVDMVNGAVFFGGVLESCYNSLGGLGAPCRQLVSYTPQTGLSDVMSELGFPRASTSAYFVWALAVLPERRALAVTGDFGLSPTGLPFNSIAMLNISMPPRLLPTPAATSTPTPLPTRTSSLTVTPSPASTNSVSASRSASAAASPSLSPSSSLSASPSGSPAASQSQAGSSRQPGSATATGMASRPAGSSPTAQAAASYASPAPAAASAPALQSPLAASASAVPAVSGMAATATRAVFASASASPGTVRVGALLQLGGVSLSNIFSSSSGLLSLRTLLQRLQLLVTAALATAPGITQPAPANFAAGIELLYVQDRRDPSIFLVPGAGAGVNAGLGPMAGVHAAAALQGGSGWDVGSEARRAQSTSTGSGDGITLSLAINAAVPGLSSATAVSAVGAALSTSNPAAQSAVSSGAASLAAAVGLSPASIAWTGASAAATPASDPTAAATVTKAEGGSGSGAAIGGVIGALLVLGVVAGVAYYMLVVRSSRRGTVVGAGAGGPRKSVFTMQRPSPHTNAAGGANFGTTTVSNPLSVAGSGRSPTAPLPAPQIQLGLYRSGSSARAVFSAAGVAPAQSASFEPAPMGALPAQPRAIAGSSV